MTDFTELDKHDLHELFRIYDFAKVNKVDDIVEHSMKLSQSPEMLFDELYKQYEIPKLPQREELIQEMHDAVPTASEAEILSVIRVTEMKKFSASDAIRALRRQMSQVNHAITSEIDNEQKLERLNDVNKLTSKSSHSVPSSLCTQEERKCCECHLSETLKEGECKWEQSKNGDQKTSSMDELVSRDVQDWVARVIGDSFSKYMSHGECSSTAFMDSLRDGVVLHILLQRLHCPSMSDDEIVIPKRNKGFFARDNVSVFLQQVHERYQLHEAELFTNSDLCDGKNDRQVITCLLSLARAAYAHGDTTYLPRLISLEREIDANKCTVTTEELDKIVADAEAEIESPTAQEIEEKEKSVGDEHQEQQQQEEQKELEQMELPDDKITSEEEEYNESDNYTIIAEVRNQESMKENAQLTKQETKKAEEEIVTKENKDNKNCEVEQSETVAKNNSEVTTTSGVQQEQQQSQESKECNIDNSVKNISTIELEEKSKDHNGSAHNPEETKRQEEINTDESKVIAKQAAHGTSRVFYVRGNRISREKTSEDNVVVSNINNPHNTHETPSEWLMRHPYSVEKPCPPHLVSIKKINDTKHELAPRYHARHWDGIDCLLAVVLNAHYARFPHSPWRFRALFSQPGEYVVYNRRSADKYVVHIRAIHDRLLIHQPQPVANKARFVYHWVELIEALEQMENV